MDSERSRSIGHEDAVTLDGQFPGMAPAPSGKRVERKQHLVAMDSFGKGCSAQTKNQREEVDVATSRGINRSIPKSLIKICVVFVFLVFAFYFFHRQKIIVDSEVGRNVDSNPKEAIEIFRLNDKVAPKLKNDRFDDWLDSLPIWLETNGFPSYFLSETRSLAVSLRAMYAERTATPNVLRGGGVESADGNLSRGFSNIFSRSLSQKYLINPEIPGRLYGLISSKVQSFNDQ